MRLLMLCLLSLCLAMPALAERKQTFGEVDVHYSVFNSSFLQPDTAAASGLIRSKTKGVVNVSVLKNGKSQNALVEGSVKYLSGQVQPLVFRTLREQSAIYHLAQFEVELQEMLVFTLTVKDSDGRTNTFNFHQEVFPGP